jgi:O-Antigen ligase
VAYAGLFLFTVLLYVRPNDLFPDLLGTLPLAKAAAGVGGLACALALVRDGKRPVWPLEATMVALVGVIGTALIPFAESPGLTIAVLGDSYVKVACIFLLLINVVDTRKRLRALLQITVLIATVFALKAVKSYVAGEFEIKGLRIAGFPGIFYNPNSLATILVTSLPLAVALGLRSKGYLRALYLACAAPLYAGIVATMSRGGFLALTAVVGVLTWKLARQSRLAIVPVVGHGLVTLMLALPSTYWHRDSTVVRLDAGAVDSARERVELVTHATGLVERHPILGIGMGNYPLHSLAHKVTHNSYLEVLVELGIGGLLAYLTLLLAPLRSLRRIEVGAAGGRPPAVPSDGQDREVYYLSIGLQAALAAFMVDCLFRSVEYGFDGYYLVAYAVSLRRIWATDHATRIGDRPGDGARRHDEVCPEPLATESRSRGSVSPAHARRIRVPSMIMTLIEPGFVAVRSAGPVMS